MPELPDDWRNRVTHWASSHRSVKQVYVFGSQATGTARKDSDLDLAVAADLDELITHRQTWATELMDSLGIYVDLYPADGPTVAAAIADHGFCIYARLD